MEKTFSWQQIILIDDDALLNLIHKKVLDLVGFNGTVLNFCNGFQAIEFIYYEYKVDSTSERFNSLIILDLEMPTLNGWGFLNRFEKLDIKVKELFKIVVSSSSLNPEDIKRAMAYECVKDYISKPLTIENFRRILEDVMDVNI